MKTYLYVINALVTVLLLSLTTTSSAAEEERRNDSELTTNIIGSQEAPAVLNVVPWKSRQVQLDKIEVTTSVLDQVLQPIDREELLREIHYYEMLNGAQ